MSKEITVKGMSCDGCEEAVEKALKGVDGIESAHADRTTDSASIEGDAKVDELVKAVEEAGYEASV